MIFDRRDWKWEPDMLVRELFDDWTIDMCGLRATNFVYVLRKFPALQPFSPFHNTGPPMCTCGKQTGKGDGAPSSSSGDNNNNNNNNNNNSSSSSSSSSQACPACDQRSAVDKFREQVLPKPPPRLVLRNSIAQNPASQLPPS